MTSNTSLVNLDVHSLSFSGSPFNFVTSDINGIWSGAMWDAPFPNATLKIAKSGDIVCISIPQMNKNIDNDTAVTTITFSVIIPAELRPGAGNIQTASLPIVVNGNSIVPFFLRVNGSTGYITMYPIVPITMIAGTSITIPSTSITYCV